MKQNRSVLFLLTDTYPYGQGEVFVGNEFPYLCKSFEKVFVFSNSDEISEYRTIPDNAHVIRLPQAPSKKDKWFALTKIFSIWFWKELWIMVFRYKLFPSLGRIKHLIYYLRRGYAISEFLVDLKEKRYIPSRNLLVYSYWGNELAMAGAILKRGFPEIRFVFRTHRFDLYFNVHPLSYLPFRAFIAKQANGIFPISANGLNYLKEIIPQEFFPKIQLAKLGTQNWSVQNRTEYLEVLNVLSCSNVVPVKRVSLLAQAFALLPGNHKVSWTHFGGGSLEEELKHLVDQLFQGRKNIVVYLKGARPNQEVLEHYKIKPVDLFVNVSISEGLPVSIMEAMSFGVPVLATRAGGTGEIVKHCLNGFLLNVNTSPGEIAKAIEDFAKLPREKKNKLRNSAFQTWKDNFDAEKNYPAFIKMLEEIP